MSVKSSLRGAQARWLALSAAFGLACFLIAYGSLLLTRADGQLAAIWPVDGVALGFILRHPRRSAWPVIFGTWTGCAAANLCWGDPPQIALVLPLANVAGVAGALFGLLRLVRRPNLLRARHLATLIVIGSVAAIGSGILGAGWLWLVDGQNFSSNALGWAVCDALGYATLAPLVQLATTPRRRVRWPSPGSVAVLLGFTAVVIAALSQNDDAFVFIVPLALFVVAYVAEASGAAVALVIAAVTSVGFLAKNLGPLSLVGGGARAQLFTLQIFLASMVFSILPIAAAMRERRRFAAAVLAARDRARQSMRRAREARRRAEEAAMERTAMLADMSHELRTPVACVLGFSNLLRDLDGLSDEARRLATGVAFASENLMSAVDGVLQFTKAEAPPTEAPTRMALACLLDNVLLLFGPQAQAKGLRIEAEVAATAPTEAQLYAGRLRQILMNLMGNAVKYTDAGSVVLRASVASPAGDLLFEVIDTGPGVPAERAQKLFRRFSRLEQEAAGVKGGTGLGLAITKAMVEGMGGEIGFRARPGGGSCFWFTTPALTPPARRAATSAPGGRRALVADDIDINRRIAARALDQLGYSTLEAATGRATVAAAQASAFDVVILDINMPGMDGLETARGVRASGASRSCLLLALSARPLTEEFSAELSAAGFDGFLRKPIAVEPLRQLLETAGAALQTPAAAR